MDNPQETKKVNSLKWLGGFFDAEGSVSFNYQPCVDIVNTCPKSIFEIKLILNSIGINFGINEREKPSKSSKKKRWDIFLRHKEQIIVFLENLKPCIYGKKKQLNLIDEWYKGSIKFDIAEKIKFLNQLDNIVVSSYKKEDVMTKLKTNNLKKYEDINVLDENDGKVDNYNDFNCKYYISGLIDGDGCFNMNRRFCKYNRNRYIPQVLFINTNKEIIKRYCSVLQNNKIGYYVNFRLAGKTTNRKRWDIMTSGVRRCEKMCSFLSDSIISKKEQCDLLLNYCKYRLLNEKSKNDEIGFECKMALQNLRK
jgi:hypothetical protein